MRPRPDVKPSRRKLDLGPVLETSRNFYAPYGLRSAAQWYSLYLQTYVERYGVEPTDAAEIALVCRAHAQLNDKAQMRGRPMTLEDYLDSAPIAGPAPQARLLPRNRLRRRGGDDLDRAGPGPAPHPGALPRRCRRPPLPGRRDHQPPRAVAARTGLRRAEGVRHGRRQARRDGLPADLRLLHLRGDDGARGDGDVRARAKPRTSSRTATSPSAAATR